MPESSPITQTSGLDRAAEVRLAARVLVVRLADLGRILVGVEQLDLPARQRGAELAQLALVLRAEPRYRFHSTPCTNSRSARSLRSSSDGVSSVSGDDAAVVLVLELEVLDARVLVVERVEELSARARPGGGG